MVVLSAGVLVSCNQEVIQENSYGYLGLSMEKDYEARRRLGERIRQLRTQHGVSQAELAEKAEFKEFAKNIALQVAAMSCQYVDKASVPADAIEAEKEILMAQINNDEKNANKPDAVKEKMILGKIGKFYETNCLTEQEYVKAADKETVGQYVAAEAKNLGGEITLKGFIRFEKGEGIEKKEEDYADEVARLAGTK